MPKLPLSARHRKFARNLSLLARQTIDLVLPLTCAGCGNYGEKLCDPCWLEWQTGAQRAEEHAAALSSITHLPVWAAVLNEGTVRKALVGIKENGRVDVLNLISGAAMRVAERVGPALGAGRKETSRGREILIVPVPARKPGWLSRREVSLPNYFAEKLAQSLYSRGAPARTVAMLRHSSFTRDQVGLGRAQRLANRGGTMRLRRDAPPLGRVVLLVVDDILTTGSTLREAVRELEFAGGTVVGGAVIAATPRLNRVEDQFHA